jgi:hypothetical protein
MCIVIDLQTREKEKFLILRDAFGIVLCRYFLYVGCFSKTERLNVEIADIRYLYFELSSQVFTRANMRANFCGWWFT